MLESSRIAVPHEHSKLPRWKHLLLQLLYDKEADHQEGVHEILDPRVDLGEAASVRGPGGGANDPEG
jgi:hypothetical protein